VLNNLVLPRCVILPHKGPERKQEFSFYCANPGAGNNDMVFNINVLLILIIYSYCIYIFIVKLLYHVVFSMTKINLSIYLSIYLSTANEFLTGT